MKNYITGMMLACQFFTSLPIHRQYEMNQKTVTAMYTALPIISLLMGGILSFIIFLNEQFFQFSTILLAVILVVASIIMTGGLHLDGWIDMGDAYFSYQDQKRRLEILEDSRVGAFGAISLVVLVILKIAFIYEVLQKSNGYNVIYFIAIPFLSRLALLLYFLTTKNVKEKGLAAYFKGQVNSRKVWQFLIFYTLIFLAITYCIGNFHLFILIVFMILFVNLFKGWSIKNFGGMTGDLLGALYEGTELALWGILLLFI
ncbi:adenosylcobinamide-GDP ribazoletransferase [Ureibacillus sp. NPDC094379]